MNNIRKKIKNKIMYTPHIVRKWRIFVEIISVCWSNHKPLILLTFPVIYGKINARVLNKPNDFSCSFHHRFYR